MTPPQVAQRHVQSHGGLIRLHPASGWDAQPRPGETPEEAAYRAAVDAATAILVAYDGGIAKHSDDVLTVSEAIADRLNVTGADRQHLTAVAQLHDIGKVTVPPAIINKPGPLNDLEWQTMRRHTIEGERILASVPEISEVARLVRSCHERYDGQGYPDGLAREQIPLVARIVFCADAFHAMRCDRPYRPGRPAADALTEMNANAGTQFDPVVVAALCDVRESLVSQPKRGVRVLGSGGRSLRLVALLATLAVGGSAMAATGAYKHLPLRDGERSDAPSVTHAPLSAVQAPVFGTQKRTARLQQRDAGSASSLTTGTGSRSSSGALTRPAAASPRSSGGSTESRRVSQGAHGTAPGQAISKPEKVAEEHKTKAQKPVKAPKVKLPNVKVKLPKVKVKLPKVNAKDALWSAPPVKREKPAKPQKPAKP